MGIFARKDYPPAIRIWKELLPQVGETQVKEVLPQLKTAYIEMGNAEGLLQLSTLENMYVDFFEMTGKEQQLDAKGRTMRQSLADKICKEVVKLPETNRAIG